MAKMLSRTRILNRILAGAAGAVLVLGAAACNRSGSVLTMSQNNLIPTPPSASSAEGLSLRDQLSRFRGQTEFANVDVMSAPGGGRMESASANDAGGGAPGGMRAEQESDIFKVGKPGTKLLFLLNSARGLQVVSFAKGADQPELLGRVKATGNYPTDMYYDQANDRLLVLERNYTDFTGTKYSEIQSRILVYDVSIPSNPKIASEVPVKGTIADSRMVGQVLYIASSLVPNRQWNQQEKNKGLVTSFALTKTEIKEVQTYALSLPSVYGEQMNIQTVTNKDGSYSYYLVAILSETGWGWWDRQSLVEVVDITDANGAIRPVMTVSAKGALRERSQTIIKDGVLITTSNYMVPNPNRVGENAPAEIARIAVETFGLPNATSEILTEKEAQYRLMHIEREVAKSTDAEPADAKTKLMNDAKLGLANRFVRADDKLRKVAADHVVTVGDTTGLSSSLQDVRYQDGLLYAFWVPANMVDPLDIFDISHPGEGVKHLSRLQFEGWISKAVPLSIGGRQFILGLGWIVPAVDNETNLRRPQAMLFEIRKTATGYRADDIAQVTFSNSNIWTDFNAADKFIEVRENGDGSGQIMFSAGSYGTTGYESGGKILNFDLRNAIGAAPEKSISEGVFLAGKSDWVRRIFTNSEIDRINTFSDMALGVFNAKTEGDARLVRASAVLELARNITGYETLESKAGLVGVQILTNYSWSSNENESKTTLRLVDAKRADTEKPGILSEVTVDGSFGDSLVLGNKLFVYGSSNSYKRLENNEYEYKSFAHLAVFEVSDNGKSLKLTGSQKLTADDAVTAAQQRFSLAGRRSSYGPQLVVLPGGRVAFSFSNKIYELEQSSVSAKELTLAGCVKPDRVSSSLRAIGNEIYFVSEKRQEAAELPGLVISKNYFSKVSANQSALECGVEVNIPGDLVAISAEGSLIVDDNWLQDFKVKHYDWGDKKPYTDAKTKKSYLGLKVSGGKAILVDEIEREKNAYSVPLSVVPGEIVQIGNFGQIENGRYGAAHDSSLEFVAVDAEGYLTKEERLIDLGQQSAGVTLSQVVADPEAAGKFLALVSSNRSYSVISWTKTDRSPILMKIQGLTEKLEPTSVVTSLSSGQSWGSRSAHFSPSLRSFEIPEGTSGVTQITISE